MKNVEKWKLALTAAEEYINSKEGSISLTQLQNKYGVRRQVISEILKNKGIEVVNYQNRSRINENVFDVIDTEEKAYWLGFIFADGNISSTGNKLEMNLSPPKSKVRIVTGQGDISSATNL